MSYTWAREYIEMIYWKSHGIGDAVSSFKWKIDHGKGAISTRAGRRLFNPLSDMSLVPSLWRCHTRHSSRSESPTSQILVDVSTARARGGRVMVYLGGMRSTFAFNSALITVTFFSSHEPQSGHSSAACQCITVVL